MESGAIFYKGSVKKNRSKVNKKARGLGSPRSELYTARYLLKDDLPNELDVAGFARSNGRSAVEVANGVGHLAETAGGSANSRFRYGVRGASAANRPHAGRQVDTVQEVEEVRSELDPDPFRNRDVLDEGEIHIAETRDVEFVSRKVVCGARASRTSRRAERGGVPPLRPKSWVEFVADACVRLADQVQSQARFIGRLSTVPVHHRADLPVVKDALCQDRRSPRRLGHIIGTTDGEKVSSVKITVSIIRLKVESIVQNLTTVLADFIQR